MKGVSAQALFAIFTARENTKLLWEKQEQDWLVGVKLLLSAWTLWQQSICTNYYVSLETNDHFWWVSPFLICVIVKLFLYCSEISKKLVFFSRTVCPFNFRWVPKYQMLQIASFDPFQSDSLRVLNHLTDRSTRVKLGLVCLKSVWKRKVVSEKHFWLNSSSLKLHASMNHSEQSKERASE